MSRSIFAAIAVLASATAFAGGPRLFTMSEPGTVYQGYPVTFTTAGGPVNGGMGLFASISPETNPLYCPSQFNGDCLDLHAPLALIAFKSLAGPGPDTFTVTPPHQPNTRAAQLQAAAISGVGNWVSNVVDVVVVPTCTPAESSFPASGDGGIVVSEDLSFTFADDIADLQTYALYQGGVEVPTTVSTSGGTATISPVSDLSPNTTYTLFTENPCSQVTGVTFTTAGAGAAGGYNLVDRTWVLDLSNINITQPAGVSALVAPLLADYDDVVAIEASGWDGSTTSLSFLQGWLTAGTDDQDLCETTSSIDGIDFSTDPNFGADIDQLGGIIENATLTGSILPDGSGIDSVSLSAYVSQTTIDDLTGLGALTCILLPCVPCPSGTGSCIFLAGNGIDAVEIDTDLVEVLTPAPGCPVP